MAALNDKLQALVLRLELDDADAFIADVERGIGEAIERHVRIVALPAVPAGTRLPGDDALPPLAAMRCTRGCNHVLTGRHDYSCAAYPPLTGYRSAT